MEFLKKHYEKLILLVLLLAFIVSMIYVVIIIDQTREIKDSDLNLPSREADYKPVNPEESQFDVKMQLASTQLHWDESKARDPENAEHFSDLVVAFPMARCPHCGKIIPRSYMVDGGKCPFSNCGKELRTPPERTTITYTITADDADGDGIPDQDETRFGLDPNDPTDGRLDKDGDGFSNLFEYRFGTSPMNAKSHPPLWYRLKLVDLRTIKIPYKLMAINTNSSDDKTLWLIQINSTDKDGKTEFKSIGEGVQIGSKRYTIKDAELRRKTVPSGEGGSPLVQDESIITLEQEDGEEKLEMQVGRDVYSPDRKAIVIDTADNREYIYDVGQAFNMGNRRTGISAYRIASINPSAMTVNLEDPRSLEDDKSLDERGGKMVVTKEGMVPEDATIVVFDEFGTPQTNMMMLGPQGMPDGRRRRQ